MRGFINNFIRASLLIALFFAIFELALLTRPNEYSYKQEYIETHIDDIEILILGNSHTEDGINPSLFESNAFNLAIEGRPLYYDVQLAEKYIPKMEKLKCVIMPIGYNFEFVSDSKHYWETRKDKNSLTFACMYYKYMYIAPEYDKLLYWPETLNSNLKYFTRLYSKDNKILIGCDSLGFRHREKTHRPDNWEELLMFVDVDYHNSNVGTQYSKGYQLLSRIARVCIDNNIKLLFITTPCYKTYTERVTKKGIEYLHSIGDKLCCMSPNIYYNDYLFDDRFDENDYYNASHLNDVGAGKLTKIIINDYNLK